MKCKVILTNLLYSEQYHSQSLFRFACIPSGPLAEIKDVSSVFGQTETDTKFWEISW